MESIGVGDIETEGGYKMIVYKVVKENDGKLVSAIARGKAKVEYEKDKWIQAPAFLKAKGFDLYAFTNKEQAKHFKSMHSKSYAIYECEGKDIRFNVWMDATFSHQLEKHGVDFDKHSLWTEPYKDTVMCGKIKLLRRLHD